MVASPLDVKYARAVKCARAVKYARTVTQDRGPGIRTCGPARPPAISLRRYSLRTSTAFSVVVTLPSTSLMVAPGMVFTSPL